MGPYFNDAIHSRWEDHPMVKDIRSIGMIAGVEVHADAAVGKRGGRLQTEMFWNGLHLKFTGDVGIVAPQFIATRANIDQMVETIRRSFDADLQAAPVAAG